MAVAYGQYTYRSHRQRTAKAFGEFHANVCTAGSSQAQLECARTPIKTNLPVDDYWKDKWLFRPDAVDPDDATRIVQSYTPSSGLLIPDLEWNNSPFHDGSGEAFELHSVFDPGTTLNDLINRGLKRCFVVEEFSFHAVPLQQEHDLGNMGFTWLREPAWVYQVGWLGPYDSRKQVNPYSRYLPGEPCKRGGNVILEHTGLALNPNDRIYVLALKPAYYDCYSASVNYGGVSALSVGVAQPITGSEAYTAPCWQVTVSSTIGLFAGDEVTLSGFSPGYFNGVYTVYSVDSPTKFSIEESWNPGLVTVFGSVSGRHPQEGLALDGDKCEIVEEWVAAAAMVEGWTDYSHVLEATANQRLLKDRQEAAAWFTAMVMQELKPHIPERTFKKILQWGPSWSSV